MKELSKIQGFNKSVFVERGFLYIREHDLGDGAIFRRICLVEERSSEWFLSLETPFGQENIFLALPDGLGMTYVEDLLRIFDKTIMEYFRGRYRHYLVEYQGNKYVLSYQNHQRVVSDVHFVPDTHIVGEQKTMIFDKEGKATVIMCGSYDATELKGCATL